MLHEHRKAIRFMKVTAYGLPQEGLAGSSGARQQHTSRRVHADRLEQRVVLAAS